MKVDNLLNRVSERLYAPSKPSRRLQDKDPRVFELDETPKVYPGKFDCEFCHDAGWLNTGEFKNGRWQTVRCICQTDADTARLVKIDGVFPHERNMTFGDIVPTEAIYKALPAVMNAVRDTTGFITLYGSDYGTGKSTILKTAVNAARSRGLKSAYRRTSHLLQELRNQFDTDEGFQARWDILIEAAVLAVDEIEKWNPSAWATERFDDLIDDRYRRMDTHLTLLAGNTIDHLDGYNLSRLQDRNAQLFFIEGPDVRKEER